MKVLCIYNRIEPELAAKVGLESGNPTLYGSVTVGNEYLVLGISYDPTVPIYAGWPVCWLRNESGGLSMIPLFMFEVTDTRSSAYWEIKFTEQGALDLLPRSFHDSFYADDLSNGDPDVRMDFDQICQILSKEDTMRSE